MTGRKKTVLNKGKKPQQTVQGYTVQKIVDKIDYRNSEHKQILYRVRWPKTWESEEHVPEDVRNDDSSSDELSECSELNQSIPEPTNVKNIFWKVKKVLDKQSKNGKTKYLIEWEDSWVWENDLNCPDLIRSFENDNQNPIQNSEKRKNEKEKDHEQVKRSAKENPASDVSVQTTANIVKKTTLTCSKSSATPPTIIQDEQIDRILGYGSCCNTMVFYVRRLNGEDGVVTKNMAQIKYPDEVMEFYEQYIMPEIDKRFFLGGFGLQSN